jgi:hypothetical protein
VPAVRGWWQSARMGLITEAPVPSDFTDSRLGVCNLL